MSFSERTKLYFRDLLHLLRHIDQKPELFFFVGVLLTVGTGGYMIIEGWGPFEAFYMVLITITTIGYGEVHNLSFEGRVFTIGLIVVGVITGSYAISSVIEAVTSETFHQERHRLRNLHHMRALTNHCIICGYGRMGRSVAHQLQQRHIPFVIIDPSLQAVEQCEQVGILAILGNGADEERLKEAGIDRAKMLVAAASTMCSSC